MLVFGFTSILSAQCLTSDNGQYPLAIQTIATCDGLTQNVVAGCGFASEFTVVTVTAGETYTFGSSIATDIVTISSDGGISAEDFGTGSLTWISTVSGDIQFYTHLDDGACGAQSACRNRYVICGIPPTCIAPTALVSSNITTTTATVDWTTSVTDPANGYEYYLSTTNTPPLPTDLPTDGVVAGITTINLTVLSSGTNYYIWVRSVCSGTDSSSWSVAATFATLCDATTVPYLQDFESAIVPALPICTSNENVGSGNNWTTASNPGYGFTTNTLRYGYNFSNPADAWFYTQGITLDAGISYDISYNYGNNSTFYTESMKVAYGASPTSTDMANPLADHPSITGGLYTGGVVQQNLVSFTPLVTGVYYFGFNVYSTANQYNLFVDDIKIVATPSCSIPTALVITSPTNNDATISWTAPANAPANGYEYYLSTTNTAPLSTDSATGSVGAGITTASLTGLTSQTTYYVWVRSVCSGSDSSEWSTVASFLTLCDSVTDFTENFDAAVAFPACWARVGTGGNTYVQVSSSAPSQPNNIYLYGSSATSRGVVSMIPVSNAGDATHRLRFKARANYTVGGNIEVGYLTNPSDATSFVGLQTFTTTSTTVYDLFTVYPGTVPGSNQVLAFRHTGVPSNSVLIDDVVWEVIPSCVEPNALAFTNVTSTSADLSWTAPSTSSLGYEYVLDNAANDPTVSGSTTTSLTYSATSLMPNTTYYFHVRTNCDATTNSIWVTVMFTTLPTPPVNDICMNAISITPGSVFADSPVVGTTVGGTTTTGITYTCQQNRKNDVWYTVVVPASGTLTVETDTTPGTTMTDSVLTVFSGTCGALTDVGCDDDSGNLNFSKVVLSALTPGDTLYIGVWTYSYSGGGTDGAFQLSAYDASLASNTFSNSNFTFYPNPVKDVLNISNATTISKVQVVNILGQEMISKSMNDTQGQVDMSQLATGTYLVKLTSDNQVKTIKIIKE